MANRMRLDTMEGETFLRQEEAVPPEGPRLGLVTSGEQLARLLEGAMAYGFSQESPERVEEHEAVERFLHDCAEFCDVRGLPPSLREEMGEHFGQRLDALWRMDWLVFGDAHEAVLEPGEHPLKGRVVTLYVARYDSPSVEMAARLRQAMEAFKQAVAQPRGPAGGLLH